MIYIDKVFINGFYAYENFEVQLSERTNIIVGNNGSGKTTFLNVLKNCLLLSWDNGCKILLSNMNKEDHTTCINITMKLSDDDETQFKNFIIIWMINHMNNYNSEFYYIDKEIFNYAYKEFFDMYKSSKTSDCSIRVEINIKPNANNSLERVLIIHCGDREISTN
jgi:predicted ATP-binding protein involved in virulence